MEDHRYHLLNNSKDLYRAGAIASKLAIDTPFLQLKYGYATATALPADRSPNNTHQDIEQYEEQWEFNILNQLAKEMYDQELVGRGDMKLLRYAGIQENNQESKRKNLEANNYKTKRKELSKFKAYAVKMKIPSNQEITKPRQKETRVGVGSQSKNKSEIRFKAEKQVNYSRMEEVFRANVRDIAIAHIFESSGANIFKKRPQKTSKQTNIRKRSIKTSDKRREEEIQVKESLNRFLKTSTSPKIHKNYVISIDQSTLQQKITDKKIGRDTVKNQHDQNMKENGFLTKSTMKSPQKDKEKAIFSKNRDNSKLDEYSPSKFLEKMEQAIHFKKKQPKVESQTKQGLKQLQGQSPEKYLSNGSQEWPAQASKTVIRAIYTSKDVIRNKSNALKESMCKEGDINKRESNNQKVIIFNSEDQYIRRLLSKAGWIINNNHRSHFYHLKWVFKPDSIDYHNLKAGQFVNHIRNSHELTAKNYLNKNLKSYLSSWTSLPSCYPKCYDFAISSEKHDFYAQFKKEVMMILLRNIYEYFLSIKISKIEALTMFYINLLNDDGSYKTEDKGCSELRKKAFRKIDMEDYRQYDNNFVVHMNLLIIALKYWRSIRKAEELDYEELGHFLSFREKEFDDNIHHLQRYSKMTLPYSNNNIQPYFEREYFATPSDIAIQRVVKEFVYFENQLGQQWNIYGKGNIWIVKPCSASRGNGIYLANDCSEILTDNRGIQSKIVQKYIQRPLIFQNGTASGRKFDLRQWVLLRSVQPLQIYMFSHCYVRICSEQFDITNINNLKAHLTNYSFNKKHYKQPSESVIDQDTFQQLLFNEKNINFVEDVRPKIKEIIINSVKSTQNLISDCGQRCFSLLGYDILLDENCQPWLLEVNMSPACEERTEWLKCYLQIMGRQLLKIVLPDSFAPPYNRGNLVRQMQSPMKKNWSPVDWGREVFQLKKVKTEMSQTNGEQDQNRQSYVNTVFELDPCKEHYQSQEEKANDEEPEVSLEDQFGDKVCQQQLIQQNVSDKEQSEEQEKVGFEENDSNQKAFYISAKNESQIENYSTKKQKFKNMELYLNDLNEKNEKRLSASPQQRSLFIGESYSKCPSPSKSKELDEDSPLMLQLREELRWQRICYEQYTGIKRDSDFQMEVLGSKINLEKINQIDTYLDQHQLQRQEAVKGTMRIQRAIRQYLQIRKSFRSPRSPSKGSQDKISLRINLSRLERGEERETKSALYTREDKDFLNFEKQLSREISANSRHLDHSTASRNGSIPLSAKLRNANEVSFREKIRSIAFQAAARQKSKDQLLQNDLPGNQDIEQQIACSHTSIQPNCLG